MNNITRQKSVQLNKAVKLISRSTSKTSKEPPMWVTPIIKTAQAKMSRLQDGKSNQRPKLLSNLPPKNMMSRRWCSTDYSMDPVCDVDQAVELFHVFNNLDLGNTGLVYTEYNSNPDEHKIDSIQTYN